MALIKKISVKTVVGNVKKMVANEEIKEKTAVMRVFGVASKVVTGTSDNGDWVAFIGQFKAINTVSGEEFASGKLFLPGVASDLLEGAVNSDEANAVEFGFDILVEPNDASATGYIYQAESLIAPSEDDTLARMEKAITGRLENTGAGKKTGNKK